MPASSPASSSTPSASKIKASSSSSATATTLVIVESPAKARKIQQYLGSSAKVIATFGHVRDLPARAGAVDPAAGFEMRWARPSAAAGRRLDELAEAAAALASQAARSGGGVGAKVVLATDPDREGEAISWHVLEELRARGAVLEEEGGGEFGSDAAAASATKKTRAKKSSSSPAVSVERATFTSVTEAAVRAALASPRNISRSLVEAYFARRALDYLFGFSLSPLLWRRVPGARSAGRVQSAALGLVAAREAEVRAFVPVDYFTVEATLEIDAADAEKNSDSTAGPPLQLSARLRQQPYGRGAVSSPGLPLASLADDAVAALRSPDAQLRVSSVRSRPSRRSPPPPFATASLQQAASALLGMSPTETMRAAQALYEGGDEAGGEALVTYHRTDGVGMPPEASLAVRDAAAELFGGGSVFAGGTEQQPTRQWRTRAKNAQEAHEAIRPTDPRRTPQSLSSTSISPRLLRLYELVWRRTLASQMADARLETVTVDVGVTLGTVADAAADASADESSSRFDGGSLRATATVVTDPGFSLAYSPSMFRGKAATAAAASATEDEAEDGEDGDGEGKAGAKKTEVGREGELPASAASAALLSSLRPGDPLSLRSASATQHATRPPPRFSEATLVAALEAAGVGRPSTYAPTVRLLVERGYVTAANRRLAPSPLGAVLAEYLRSHFGAFVDAAYTSSLEEALDEVAAGRSGWKSVLGGFWGPLEGAVEAAAGVSTREVIDGLDASLGDAILRAEAKARLARREKASGVSGGSEEAAEKGAAVSSPAVEELDAAVAAARVCPSCGGRLGLKLASGSGGFFGCSGYPSCTWTRPLWVEEEDGRGGGGAGGEGSESGGSALGSSFSPSSSSSLQSQQQQQQSRDLGSHPDSGLPISLRQGPYGPYIQLGEQPEKTAEERAAEKKTKAKMKQRARGNVRRVSLPKGLPPSSVTLERALALLEFPKDLGPAPPPSFWPRPPAGGGGEAESSSSGGSGTAGDDAPLSSSSSSSLSSPGDGSAAADATAAATAAATADPGVVQVAAGPYGYYVRLSGGSVESGDGQQQQPLSLSAPLPAGADPAAVTLEEAVALLAARAARGPSSRGRRGVSSSASAAKSKKEPKEPKEKKTAAAKASSSSSSSPAEAKKKRPPSAYQLFCSSERPNLSPGTAPTAAMAELAARWRALGNSERAPFEAAAAEAKAKKKNKKAKQEEGGSEGAKKTASSASSSAARKAAAAAALPPAGGAAARGNNKAKRPPSPYILFCAAERASAVASLPAGSKPSSVLAELGSRWRGLGEAEKGRFVAAAAAAAAASATAAEGG